MLHWKLLLWAVAPYRSHATLGATVCRQVLSRALIPGCAQHHVPPLRNNFDDVESLWKQEVDCGTSAKLLIDCGNSHRDTVSLSVWRAETPRKQIFIQDKSHWVCRNWIAPNLWLNGVHGGVGLEDAAVSSLRRTVFYVTKLQIFTHERLQVAFSFLQDQDRWYNLQVQPSWSFSLLICFTQTQVKRWGYGVRYQTYE